MQATSKRTKPQSNGGTANHNAKQSPETVTSNGPDKKLRRAFLSDEEIANSFVFRLLYYIFLIPVWRAFWAFTEEGFDKIPKQKDGKGIFFITRHTTHNTDIVVNLMSAPSVHGHVIRSLLHRVLYNLAPITPYMGCVPGQRDTAINLINGGFWTAVIPGGAEEAMKGHQNAYNLSWGSRQGFAHVAKQTKCVIVPCTTRNGEEMKWNPIFWIINLLRLYKPYDWLLEKNVPFLSWFVKQVAMYSWYLLAFLGIPIPVKCTVVVGDPVDYDPEKDSIEEIVRKSQAALQKLLDENHPEGKSYWRGLKERYEYIQQSGGKKKKTN